MYKLSSLFFILISLSASAQYTWQWTELDTMPFRTANNAVCEAEVNGEEFVYSFGGIDTSKIYSGINKRSFKYTVATDTWAEIDPLPDAEPKIASGASFVNGKIYIIGGYHVYSNGTEVSSDKVHIYNPTTDSYEADGAAIPLAIDDHVQCVYKDSLIYVVTGWSNTSNRPNVQIYNPALNQWEDGTYVPVNYNYTAFGASGYILGDTLYYHGGAAGGSFAARNFMRKGYINPLDPTDITWTQMDDAPGADGYRSACSGIGNTIFWVGGSPTSYNYNGIAYDGSGGVNPSARILHFNTWNYQHQDNVSEPYGVMDLRGIAKLSNDRWIICGGMDTSQMVSNRTFLLENTLVGQNEIVKEEIKINYESNVILLQTDNAEQSELLSLSGQQIMTFDSAKKIDIDRTILPRGIYIYRKGESSIKITN